MKPIKDRLDGMRQLSFIRKNHISARNLGLGLALVALSIFGNGAKAEQISFSSGTGFYVSSQHIITNEHVVQGCKYIKVRGAVKPSFAELIDVNKEADLALLRTQGRPSQIAALRGSGDVKKDEKITILGYPLDHGITGKYLVRKATVTDTQDPFGKKAHFLFSDSVEKGNSGGPIVDQNGTVVGVVVGKMSYYTEQTSAGGALSRSPLKTASVGISLSALKSFLNRNNIFYHIDNIRYGYTEKWLESKAKQYIVNIHCIQ